jgi:hypothetical protein
MDDRRSRVSDLLLVVLPLAIGGGIGLTVGQRIATGNPADCGEPVIGTLSTAFILGGIVVVLLVGTIVARAVAGPMVGRALLIAAVGILLSSCASVVLTTPADSCPQASASQGVTTTLPFARPWSTWRSAWTISLNGY